MPIGNMGWLPRIDDQSSSEIENGQDCIQGYSQPELSKLARQWRSGRCNLLNAWKRPWTSEIELVAVAVVPSIRLGIRGGEWTARRELLGGRAHSRSPFDFAQGRLSATLGACDFIDLSREVFDFKQKRHPERGALQIYRLTERLWRGVESRYRSVRRCAQRL
jgi:hypothetical protein